MSLDQARSCLSRATSQLEKVQNAADAEDAVMWAFYAYENCVVALAEMHNRDWERNHYSKARLARVLFADGLTTRDVGDELEELNRLRKDVAYGEPGRELEEKDLEMLASQLEEFVEAVQESLDVLT